LLLLQSQRNEVFRLIQAAGVDPVQFQWDTGPGVERIVHRPSGHSFSFVQVAGTGRQGILGIRYSPGTMTTTASESLVHWSQAKDFIHSWLESLERELAEPDLWGELERQRELLGGAAEEIENTPFTPEEQEEVVARLSEAKEYVRRTQELPPEQIHALETRIDYLIDATGRLPRLDWRNAALGALIGHALQTAVPSEVVRDVLGMIFRGLGQLFGLDLPPPLPSVG
jgi:hypothetical protein